MPSPSWLSAQRLPRDQVFITGKAASYFVGEWRLATFNQGNALLNMVPYNVQKAIELGGIAYALNRNTKHKQAAWEFMKYVTASESAQELVVRTGMGLSGLKRMPPMSFPGKRTDIMLASMNYLRKIDMFPEWAQINQTVEEPNLAKIWNGEAAVRPTMEAIAQQSNAILGW